MMNYSKILLFSVLFMSFLFSGCDKETSKGMFDGKYKINEKPFSVISHQKAIKIIDQVKKIDIQDFSLGSDNVELVFINYRNDNSKNILMNFLLKATQNLSQNYKASIDLKFGDDKDIVSIPIENLGKIRKLEYIYGNIVLSEEFLNELSEESVDNIEISYHEYINTKPIMVPLTVLLNVNNEKQIVTLNKTSANFKSSDISTSDRIVFEKGNQFGLSKLTQVDNVNVRVGGWFKPSSNVIIKSSQAEKKTVELVVKSALKKKLPLELYINSQKLGDYSISNNKFDTLSVEVDLEQGDNTFELRYPGNKPKTPCIAIQKIDLK